MEEYAPLSALLPSALFIEPATGETKWKCNKCLISFTNRNFLDLHLGTVEVIRSSSTNPYLKVRQILSVCKLCGKKFDTDQGLQQHIGKKHNQEKKSSCEFCNKAFTHKYAVKFHINQVHTKSSRAICRYCSNSFYNNYSMRQHSKKCKFRFPKRNISELN